jgi:hypothetical protein
MCVFPCTRVRSVLRLYADIDPEAMSEATRAYFQGQRAGHEAQPNAHSLTQRCDHVTADEERGDLIAEHPSMQAPSPSSRVNLEIGSGLENHRSEMEEMHLNTAVLPNACANAGANPRG